MSARLRRVAAWPGWWVVVAAAGLAVRFRHLAQNHSYWYDEAYLLLNLFRRTYAEMLGRFELGQVVPPGFAWAERAAFDLFGPAEWAMRLPAFAAGLTALGLMAVLGRRVLAPQFAWLPLAFVALSRHALAHAVEVKPYSFDLAFAALVLLAVAGLGTRFCSLPPCGGGLGWGVTSTPHPNPPPQGGREPEAVVRGARCAGALLLAAAAVGPWVSFPGVFVLGGAGAALLVQSRWRLAATFAGVVAASAAGVWYAHARLQYSQSLDEFWGPKGMGGFPDLANPLAAALWPLKAGINIGNYGSRDMGAVLLLFGAIGLIANARRRPPLVVAVAVSTALALAAAYLGKYPLAERTGMFLLPSLWLAGALGVEAVVTRFAARAAVALLPFVMIAPDATLTAGNLAVPPRYPPCREAFEKVRAERRSGDMLWISSPEVYRVYHGPDDVVYGHQQFPDEWEAAARRAPRVWVVNQFPPENPYSCELATRLTRAGLGRAGFTPFWGVRVELWEKGP